MFFHFTKLISLTQLCTLRFILHPDFVTAALHLIYQHIPLSQDGLVDRSKKGKFIKGGAWSCLRAQSADRSIGVNLTARPITRNYSALLSLPRSAEI